MSKRQSVTSEAGNAANGRVRIDATSSTSKNMIEPKANGNYMPVDVSDSGPPITWITTKEVQQTGMLWRGNHVRRGEHGIERLPGITHVGDGHYNPKARQVHPRALSRFRRMLVASGHVQQVTHSNGSAHLPVIEHGRFSRDGYCQHILNKGIVLGWIDIEGPCLKRQIADGLVNPRRVLTLADVESSPLCKPGKPCKHIEAEQSARRTKHEAKEREVSETLKSNEQRLMEEMKGRDGAMVNALTKLVDKLGDKV